MADAAVAVNPADLEDAEWPLRAEELAAVVAWVRGTIDRAGFRRWLRTERWPAEDIDDLTVLLEHLMATERRMPAMGGVAGGGRGLDLEAALEARGREGR